MHLPINESTLCRGNYWSVDEASGHMQDFASKWSDLNAWEARAATIRKGILDGLAWDKMPPVEYGFSPLIHSRREMDGYIVENIAIESFPGFYITGNLYYQMSA